jgi:hypothetical protein
MCHRCAHGRAHVVRTTTRAGWPPLTITISVTSHWTRVASLGTMVGMRSRSSPASAARWPRPRRRRAAVSAVVALVGLCAGCRPTRTLVVESVPPGAVVRLDEQVIGRTPLEHKFQHYGERRLSLYSPGYRTHSERVRIGAPWYARFPIDLITEVILPLGLDHRVELPVVVLEPDDGIEAEPAAAGFVSRAGEVRADAREAAAAARAAAAERAAARAANAPPGSAPEPGTQPASPPAPGNTGNTAPEAPSVPAPKPPAP